MTSYIKSIRKCCCSGGKMMQPRQSIKHNGWKRELRTVLLWRLMMRATTRFWISRQNLWQLFGRILRDSNLGLIGYRLPVICYRFRDEIKNPSNLIHPLIPYIALGFYHGPVI